MAYSGWYLPEDEQARMLALIAPAYPDVIAHHVTLELGDKETLAIPDQVVGEIIGFADDGAGVQALIMRINGTTIRPMGGTYHITWSLDRAAGRKPVDSNTVIAEKGWTPFSVATQVRLEPKVFS
jgi:hypothetical protein